ncbi:MAG: ThiF family adenylyltransferase, partial [Paramuribaculum sp.]|nr:ThiF family adenylyltransferase [Paramuribaculum sp.]
MSAERYLRQTMLAEIGEAGQRRLRDSRVLVVGLGGLGAVVTTYLAGAGIGTLVLADHDTVSLSNLQRQVLYSEADVGKPKAECAARRVAALNSDVAFEICRDGLSTDNAGKLVGSCDLVVDCTDNYPARFLIDDTCAALH